MIEVLAMLGKFKLQGLSNAYGTFATKSLRILKVLKIFDKDGTLSLTNLGVGILLYKIGTAAALDWPTASALLLSLLSYNYKRMLNAKADAAVQAEVAKLAQLEDKIQELNRAFNLKNLGR